MLSLKRLFCQQYTPSRKGERLKVAIFAMNNFSVQCSCMKTPKPLAKRAVKTVKVVKGSKKAKKY